MPKVSHPRHGSMQFWPRSRSRHTIARVRSWASEGKAKPLGFIGYKVGMTQIHVVDNYSKSMTKGENVVWPTTIVECPPMVVAGVVIYSSSTNGGIQTTTTVLAPKLDAVVGKRVPLPKKAGKTLDAVSSCDDVRLLVYSKVGQTTTGTKKPALIEVALGGSASDKLVYAKSILGKEITIKDVFDAGNSLDIHGITKGKGFQGTVKRFGVPIRQHKAEKTKRGIATIGSWTPKRVEFTVAMPGKMGFHTRTEYNKQLLKIGENGEGVNPKGGINKYGLVRNQYLLIRGSIVGPQRRAVLMTASIRPNVQMTKDAPEITHIVV